MTEETKNNEAVKRFRAKEHGLNRSRAEFYLTAAEKLAVAKLIKELRNEN